MARLARMAVGTAGAVTLDWAPWLGPGDVIAASLWVPGPGLVKTAAGATGTTATVGLRATVAGLHEAVNRVVTRQGRQAARLVRVAAREEGT